MSGNKLISSSQSRQTSYGSIHNSERLDNINSESDAVVGFAGSIVLALPPFSINADTESLISVDPIEQQCHPYTRANIFSKLLFLWIIPVLWCKERRNLKTKVPFGYDSKSQGNLLQRKWDTHFNYAITKAQSPKLKKALIGLFGLRYAVACFLILIDELAIRITQVIFLRHLILSFSDGTTREYQFLYAGGLCFTAFIHAFLVHTTLHYISRTALKIRVSCSSLVYQKILRLDKTKSSQKQTCNVQDDISAGKIVNILSGDIGCFDTHLNYIPYVIVGPFQLLIFSYLLLREFGIPPTLYGIGIVGIICVFQIYTGYYSKKIRKQISEHTDRRSQAMTEMIDGIRAIKMYTWESVFAEKINRIRKVEMQDIMKKFRLQGFNSFLFSFATKLVPFVTVVTFVLLENHLVASKIFFAVTIFNITMQVMVNFFSKGVAGIGEIRASVQRLEEFLLLKENLCEVGDNENSATTVHPQNSTIKMDSVNIQTANRKSILSGINLNIEGNKLIVVVGANGSGKTALLHTLLGELPVSSGSYTVEGSTSFAAQQSFIFTGTIRQNIIMGNNFDQQLYDDVIKMCALEQDFNQLPSGDLFQVGERGTALSGGQKARVNLARTLYQQADIYFLDDPLSAVDPAVSNYLFEKCIKEYLQDHMRILVTHQLQYLHQADYIIVIENGQIAAQGTYDELNAQNVDCVIKSRSLLREKGEATCSETGILQPATSKNTKSETANTKLEDVGNGRVAWKTYWNYFYFGNTGVGYCNLLFIGLIFILSQSTLTFNDFWLLKWITSKSEDSPQTEVWYDYYIRIYFLIIAGVLLTCFTRAFGFLKYCVTVSRNIHTKMLQSLMRAPSKFFDDNPSGRITNRFIKELGSIDEQIPTIFYDMVTIFFQVIGVAINIIYVNHYNIIPCVIICPALWLLRRLYSTPAGDLKRIESNEKSPVFTHVTASFEGLITIRAAKAQSKFSKAFDDYQDSHSAAAFMVFSAARYFALLIEIISVLFLSSVTFTLLTYSVYNEGDGSDASLSGDIGLAISSALTLTGWFQLGIRQSMETENLMILVERALEYTKIISEAPLASDPETTISRHWPESGKISFNDVSLAHNTDVSVLKNLRFDIRPHEKIGIVGRTGAGKSSLIQALFRMTETSGSIDIDGINIRNIGLHDLRRRISIIPQDPFLFSGTVQYNLDPLQEFQVQDLWNVLAEVHLNNSISSLDFLIKDGGNNLSFGQRQLLCLARAILRKNKIIVMDEATANIDDSTERLIQETIRTKFLNCTVITIAHRLKSIINSDRILVLEDGCLKEFGQPHSLLENPTGLFTKMVDQTGKTLSDSLRRMAFESYNTFKQPEPFLQPELPEEELPVRRQSRLRRFFSYFRKRSSQYEALA